MVSSERANLLTSKLLSCLDSEDEQSYPPPPEDEERGKT